MPRRRAARELADIVRGEGLTVTCLTARGLPAGGDERDAFLDRYLELCADLRCRLLKISSDPAWLREAVERAQAHDVVLAGNNHVGTALQTVSGTRGMLSQVGHRNYGLLYDSAHLHMAGEDYLGCIPSLLLAHAQRAGALLPARRRRRGAVPGARRAGLGQRAAGRARRAGLAGDSARLQAARLRRPDHRHRERLEPRPARGGRPPQRRLHPPLVGPRAVATPWVRTMTFPLRRGGYNVATPALEG